MKEINASNKRGQDFEKRLAKLIRQKLGIKAVRDSRSGAGDVYKADIAVPGLAWHIEAKSQEKINIRDWWKQTENSCSRYKSPLLVIDDTGYDEWAVMRFSDFLDLVRVINDDTETINSLRSHNNE